MRFFSSIWEDIRDGTNLDIYITVFASFILVILGILGVVNQNVIFSAILGCLALVSGSLLVNRRDNEKLQNSFRSHKFQIDDSSIIQALTDASNNIIETVDGVKVKSFSDRQEYTIYKTNRLQEAKKINDVTWRFQGYETQTYSRGDIAAHDNERKTIAEILRKPNIIWRSVAVFSSPEHFKREEILINDPENINLNFGFYEDNANNPLPRIGFMIVDDQELFIAYPHKSVRLTIQHSKIVELFTLYFEDIWQNSLKLKQGDKVYENRLQQLAEQFK